METQLQTITRQAAKSARGRAEKYSGLIQNENVLKGTLGMFESFVSEKLEYDQQISEAEENLRDRATELNRLKGFTVGEAIKEKRKEVLAAIDALEDAIVRNGKLNDYGRAIYG